jgi:hypothetical protein
MALEEFSLEKSFKKINIVEVITMSTHRPVYIGAVIAKGNILSPLCLFDKTIPINLAVASGNGIKEFRGEDKFKFQITLDRHNARLKLSYCLFPDPPNFSLLYTFKESGFSSLCALFEVSD